MRVEAAFSMRVNPKFPLSLCKTFHFLQELPHCLFQGAFDSKSAIPHQSMIEVKTIPTPMIHETMIARGQRKESTNPAKTKSPKERRTCRSSDHGARATRVRGKPFCSQAMRPPSSWATSRNPRARSFDAACAERLPERQTQTTGV